MAMPSITAPRTIHRVRVMRVYPSAVKSEQEGCHRNRTMKYERGTQKLL